MNLQNQPTILFRPSTNGKCLLIIITIGMIITTTIKTTQELINHECLITLISSLIITESAYKRTMNTHNNQTIPT